MRIAIRSRGVNQSDGYHWRELVEGGGIRCDAADEFNRRFGLCALAGRQGLAFGRVDDVAFLLVSDVRAATRRDFCDRPVFHSLLCVGPSEEEALMRGAFVRILDDADGFAGRFDAALDWRTDGAVRCEGIVGPLLENVVVSDDRPDPQIRLFSWSPLAGANLLAELARCRLPSWRRVVVIANVTTPVVALRHPFVWRGLGTTTPGLEVCYRRSRWSHIGDWLRRFAGPALTDDFPLESTGSSDVLPFGRQRP